MAKQEITPELKARIRAKLIKRFITWFLIATILMAFILYNTSGNPDEPKQFNPLFFILGCVLFFGIPVGLTAYWIEKWTILGYGVEKEKKIISYIFTGIAALTWIADIEPTDISRLVLVFFAVYCVANIVHYRRYLQDKENGTLPEINITHLEGKDRGKNKEKAEKKSKVTKSKAVPEPKKVAEPIVDDKEDEEEL